MSTTFGILFFDDFEELDAVGPWEVFGVAVEEAAQDRLIAISKDGNPVRGRKGLKVAVDYSLADCPKLDVILVPGGEGTKRLLEEPEILAWINERGRAAIWATSVCTGARLMIKSGLAKGKRVTTLSSAIEELRGWGEAEVLSGPRYVRDGNVVTSAGVSAGIDMALWVIGQLYSPDFARHVQHLMQYDPAPPYTADV